MRVHHEWYTVNREVWQPHELSIDDVIEEFRVALRRLSENEFGKMVGHLDRGQYDRVGGWLAIGLHQLSSKPNK